MTNAELQDLIDNGENEHVDFKVELNVSDPKGKSEFVKDVISLANSHGEGSRFLLIGVDENAPPRDISHLNLDDAHLHQIVDAYVEPRVNFAFRTISHQSVTLGAIEIAQSSERFHLVKKDLHGLDTTGKQIKLLERGQIWIRRGAAKSPINAQDFQLLRQSFLNDYLSQPLISVSFANGNKEVEIAADWVGTKGGWPDTRSFPHNAVILIPRMFQAPHPPGTAPLVFRIENLSTIEARNIVVAIELPAGCALIGRTPISVFDLNAIKHLVKSNDDTMFFKIDNLLRRPMFTTDYMYVVFPHPDEAYEFSWTVIAGNMLTEKSGTLTVRLSSREASPTKKFPGTQYDAEGEP